MVAEVKTSNQHQQLLTEAAYKLPKTWAVTPVDGNKRPYRSAWQNEQPLTQEQLTTEISSGRAKGYGLRTGVVSSGIVAIDADGHSAHEKIVELSGGEPLPETVAFTSNRLGRCQYLFYVPEEYWSSIKTTKIKTGVTGDDGKLEQLELRWDGCQSVLPPSVHPETGFYRWVKSPEEIAITPAPMWVIEKMLIQSEPVQEKPHREPTRYTQKLRTGKEWTVQEWALDYLSALSPYRADDYDDWLKVGLALHSVDNSLVTEWDNWSRQSSKYKPGECEEKWKTFKKGNVSIAWLGKTAKQDGWRSPFEKSSGRGYGGGIGGKKPPNIGGGSGSGGDGGDGGDGDEKNIKLPSSSPDTLLKQLDALIKEDLSGATLTERLNQLAQENGRPVIELRRQHGERLSEVEREEERGDNQSQIETLLDASRASIDLHKTLPSSLAEPLLKLSSWLNLKPEVYLTALLTTTSILHNAGTRVVLNKAWDFEVSPNLFSAILALSSQKKSPILKAISTKPLRVLQKEAQLKYKQELQHYEEELREWEGTKKEDRGAPPIKPERKIYFITKATGEGLTYQAARYPEQGILYLSDELTGMLNGQNQYRGGKGSDKQDLLMYYDGSGEVVLRAEGVKSEVDFISLGILGGIQPQVIQKLLGSCDDPDGGWARFMFVNQPLAPSKMSGDGGKYDLTELLVDLYKKIDALPATQYHLSPQAFKLFCKAYNQLEDLRVNERLEGMRSVWGKSEGRIGKLAVNLHVIHSLMKGEIPSQEIPVEIIRIAIKLTKFYAQQVQSLYTQFSDPDALAPQLAKVIELSHQRGGWIKASDVYLSITKKHRPTGEVVRNWFSELVVMGKGEIKGEGRSVQFRAFLPNESPPIPPTNPPLDKLDDFRQGLDKSSKTQTTLYQEVQEKLDKLDKLDKFQKNRNEVEDIEEEVVDLTIEIGKKIFLDDLSNLSNLTQDVESERDTALDDLSNQSSNLDNQPPVSNKSFKLDNQPPVSNELSNLDDLSNELSNESPKLDDLSNFDNQSQVEAIAPIAHSENTTEADAYTEEDVEYIAGILADEKLCADMESLAVLRKAWNAENMNKACKRLPVERHAQIKEWVIVLNSRQLQVGDRVFVTTRPHTDGSGPYLIESIHGDEAKLEMFGKLIPLVELRKS